MSDTVKIGGEERPRVILPTQSDNGTPRYWKVKVISYRKKQGKPNDQGEETWFYSWGFEILEEGEYAGVRVYGSTNDEARRSYTTKKPMKLLQLITAVNGGTEPGKGEAWSLDDVVGKELNIELEDKQGVDGEQFQNAARFFPAKTE